MRAPKGSTNPQAERANVAAGAKRVTLTLHRPPLLQVDLVSRASGRSVWVHRIEVRVTPLHGGAVIVRTAESKMRKRRSRTITLTLPAAGTYEVAVRTSDHAEQTMEVEIGPNEHRVLAVELPTAD